MVHRRARQLKLAVWVVMALCAVGCASKQVSSAPTPPPPQTHEQGEPSSEQAGGAGSDSGGGEGTSGSSVPRPSGSAMTPAEERSEGDRKLDESLAEFEERLVREREGLAEANNAGSGSGEETESGETASGGNAGAPAGGRTSDERTARPGDPENLPDGSDDDIVAQQLRELAESEEDPEKRAIYWQDYLDYKSGERSKSGRQE